MNIWWDDAPAERYWLEITDRDDLGVDLLAPKVDDAGRAYWSYNLVTEVRDGDIVLHWHKTLLGVPAMVGWSVASGSPEDSTIIWQARGTAGRKHGATGEEPAWRQPLVDYTPLRGPVYQDGLRREERSLRALHDQLLAEHGKPLYFPFAFSEKRPVRTAQGYLVKFPSALLDAFPELDAVPRLDSSTLPEKATPTTGPRIGDAGYQTDPRVRKALEVHAVEAATKYFLDLGYTVENVGATQPYDLRLSRDVESRRVEVKGSSGSAITVELTDGEVRNARRNQPTDLFLVDSIDWLRLPDGSVMTAGGNVRLLRDWKPTDELLQATKYRYTVPTTW